jgi:hypothetical protein
MIREAGLGDIGEIAALAHARRLDAESAQTRFWKRAADAHEVHTSFLASQVLDDGVLTLVAADPREGMLGYLFATLTTAPPVYDPGGLTGSVDDFAVVRPGLWLSTGTELLREAKALLVARNATQIVVVTGRHDQAKREALAAVGLTIASEWWVQPLDA